MKSLKKLNKKTKILNKSIKKNVSKVKTIKKSKKIQKGGNPIFLEVPNKEGSEDEILCIAWSHKGQKLATASTDKILRIWDMRNEKKEIEREIDTSNTNIISSLAWSPTEMILASVSKEKTVFLWNLTDGSNEVNPIVLEHESEVLSIAWMNTFLACGCENGNIYLWNILEKSNTISTYHTEAVCSLAYLHKNKILASADNNNIFLARIANKKLVHFSNVNNTDLQISLLSWIPNNFGDYYYLISICGQQIIYWLFSVISSKLVKIEEATEVGYTIKTISSFEKRLAVAGESNIINVYNLANHNYSYQFTLEKQSVVHSISWSPDGGYLANSNSNMRVQINK